MRENSKFYDYDIAGHPKEIESQTIERALDEIIQGNSRWKFDDNGRIVRKNDTNFSYGANGRVAFASRDRKRLSSYDYDENFSVARKESASEPVAYYFDGLISDGVKIFEPISIGGILIGVSVNGSFQFRPFDPRQTPLPNGIDTKSIQVIAGKRKRKLSLSCQGSEKPKKRKGSVSCSPPPSPGD